jgi:hypothetical protein
MCRSRSLRSASAILVLAVSVCQSLFFGAVVASATDVDGRAYDPAIVPDNFVLTIDNPYFPLYPGTTFIYEGRSDSEAERNSVVVTFRKKMILGVETTVVRDTVWVDGEIAEKTFDWYAQDRQGNVWYFGEFSQEYEDGVPVNTEGSWKAGVDGAKPGIVMPAHPRVGQTYRQEYYAGEAEDMARVLRLDASLTVPYGSFDDVLVTREWTPLEAGVAEQKYYAPCIGNIAVRQVEGGRDYIDLIEIRTLANVKQPGCDD